MLHNAQTQEAGITAHYCWFFHLTCRLLTQTSDYVDNGHLNALEA